MADKTIRKIDSRRGKRGRRETFSFSGVEAQDHIDELVAEIRMTKSDLETYQSNASSSASAAAQSASDASDSSAAAQSAEKSASEHATSAESSAEASAAYAERAAEAVSECEGYVSQAESSAASAAGSAGSAAGYAAEAKKAAESVTEKAAGVNTWNGRSGTVLPQSGDYTADMVGAVSEDTYNAKVTEIDKDLNTVGEDITALEKRVSANETAISSKANASEVVSSWNGRAGAVTPQKGDYTADMVGALANDSVTTTYSATGTAPVNGQAVASAISNKADSSTVSALASVVASKADQTILDTVEDNSVTGISISGKTVTITKGDGTTETATTQDTTYSNATTSAAGLMSASDKAKLNGIATGATKVTVDSELSSSSTNPVQNKAVNSAISTISTEVNARPKTRRLATKSLTASGGTVSWTDSSIGSTSLIDVYASLANIAPTAITQSGTTVSVTFGAQDSAFTVAIVVMN